MNDQAKLLLSAYRPGGADANDPAFAEALAQAERDPQLRVWLEESQRFDQTIAGKLREVAVPANLRATILAGAKFSRPRRWWQGSRVWALAAAVAVFASVFALLRPANSRLDTWQTDSLAVLDKIETGAAKLDTEKEQPAQLVDWLREHAAPVPSAIPPALASQPTFGCKTIDSRGRTVSLICFNLGNEDQAHLFTTSRTGLKIELPEKHPVFVKEHHWNLASWSSGNEVYMLATQMDETRLRALLPASIVAHLEPLQALLGELLVNP